MLNQRSYCNLSQAIISLHERGYVEDFELLPDGLLWIQRKIHIKSSEFFIIESHRFTSEIGARKDVIIYGVMLLESSIRGIMVSHLEEVAKQKFEIILSTGSFQLTA